MSYDLIVGFGLAVAPFTGAWIEITIIFIN